VPFYVGKKPSCQTMVRWLCRYDQGKMDSILAVMGLTRSEVAVERETSAQLINNLVVDSLVNLGKDQILAMNKSDVVDLANDIRHGLGLASKYRSRGWISKRTNRALQVLRDREDDLQPAKLAVGVANMEAVSTSTPDDPHHRGTEASSNDHISNVDCQQNDSREISFDEPDIIIGGYC